MLHTFASLGFWAYFVKLSRDRFIKGPSGFVIIEAWGGKRSFLSGKTPYTFPEDFQNIVSIQKTTKIPNKTFVDSLLYCAVPTLPFYSVNPHYFHTLPKNVAWKLGYITKKIFKKYLGRLVLTCSSERMTCFAINVILMCITYSCSLQFINFASRMG